MNTLQNNENWNKSPSLLRLINKGSPYFIKTPWWLKKAYPSRVWDLSTSEKNIYLTFDDGPHPVATPFVLDELKKYTSSMGEDEKVNFLLAFVQKAFAYKTDEEQFGHERYFFVEESLYFPL